MIDTVVITRHQGAVDWLVRHGWIRLENTRVVAHATKEDVLSAPKVFGVLPLHLAGIARNVYSIDVPNLPEEKRGKELTADEMDDYKACVVKYFVQTVMTGQTDGWYAQP